MGIKRRIKAILGRIAFGTGLYRLFFRSKAVIVLFHRVDDTLDGDPISCSRGTFAAFCDFFRRYFVVVPLGELLEKLRRGDDISRHLAITFDDGYRDNWENAATDLRARDLPACFFIATGFIGTNRIAPWDDEVGIESHWMSWDDVRALEGSGFEIGAHTVNHVDLGQAVGSEASREIIESKQRLEDELGRKITMFSYPFGRRDQITEENREAVRDAGFTCCFSAYGGTVGPQDDLYRLERTPISLWFASPFQFGFETMFVRPRAPGSAS